MITINNLVKSFRKQPVINGVSLQLDKGECIALIGPNGCGKTTLIKCLLGLVIPGKGEIRVMDKSIANDFSYREHIGYMPQIGRYPANMSIGQVFNMLRDLRGGVRETDETLFNQFKLNGMAGKKMGTLSGGTTQKVSAALAFLFNPDILILDEPTAGLDPLAAEILKEKIIAEKQKGKLILITSHLLSELDGFVTRIIFMQEGEVVFHKTVDELKAETGEQTISRAITNYLKKAAA